MLPLHSKCEESRDEPHRASGGRQSDSTPALGWLSLDPWGLQGGGSTEGGSEGSREWRGEDLSPEMTTAAQETPLPVGLDPPTNISHPTSRPAALFQLLDSTQQCHGQCLSVPGLSRLA